MTDSQDTKYNAILKTLKRERAARKAAERIIEEKSSEIYRVNQELIQLNQNLEKRIRERTIDIEKSKKDLEIAKKIAEEATASKSSFLSNMSHEIRTPLNGIKGITELLLKEDLSPEHLKMLDSIKYSADNLILIINEILYFSKIEAGKMEFDKIDFNLKRLIDEFSKNMRFSAENKNLKLILDIDPEMPDYINGDPVKLNQVLTNLMGNAIKFTDNGFVKLKVCTNIPEDYQSIKGLYFSIEDSGIGIPKDKLGSIFESFKQSDASTSRKFGGTGLGLTISKNFVELQGGKMYVESTEGKGSQFQFIYPCKKLNRTAEHVEQQTEEYHYCAIDAKILLVEDNKLNQFVASKFLNKWSVSVDIANHGKEALFLLSKNKYDLVLMDIQMPEMNGLDATKAIRDKKGKALQKDIPIIALTANAFEDTKREIFAYGMNAFVSKPLNPEELHQKINELIAAK
jgi:signal transduction histidine kinase/CheY-like chemotaxis protein